LHRFLYNNNKKKKKKNLKENKSTWLWESLSDKQKYDGYWLPRNNVILDEYNKTDKISRSPISYKNEYEKETH
jgi:hypothetical protein